MTISYCILALEDLSKYFDTTWVTVTYRQVRVLAALEYGLPLNFSPHLLTMTWHTPAKSVSLNITQLVGPTHPVMWIVTNTLCQGHAVAFTLISTLYVSVCVCDVCL